jgi:5S rRNA maturation endonuclease (ribonuclease M5)
VSLILTGLAPLKCPTPCTGLAQEVSVETEERLKRLGTLLEKLKGGWIFVEGKKDRKALEMLGLKDILTISGNLRLSVGRLSGGKAGEVFVLTDLDRRGDELALRARDELEACSIRADLEMRKELAHILKIRNFEDAKRAYDKLKQEGENNG